ncbi:hypothetical protein Tco_0229107, partial [Tanacetum coccineum]
MFRKLLNDKDKMLELWNGYLKKDKKQSQNDKTGLGMEKQEKDKVKVQA